MTRFEKASVWITSIAVAISGFGYTWTKYFVESADPFAVINHPLEPWFLRVHVVAAPLFVFVIGLIAGRHIWTHIRNRVRQGRRTGLSIVISTVPMVMTGYLLQVITGLGWLGALAVAHIVLGTVFFVGLVLHQATVGQRRSVSLQESDLESGQEGESGQPRPRQSDSHTGREAAPGSGLAARSRAAADPAHG